MKPIRIAVAGAAGRMGHAVVRCVFEDAGCTLVGAVESRGHNVVGCDAGFGGDLVGVEIADDWPDSFFGAEAIIDFTNGASSADLAEKLAGTGIVHVMGATGFTAEQEERIATAAESAAIVKSGNMSLGANLVAALSGQAARVLRDFDVQIVEMHHRNKKDAPSGTALMLGHAITESRAGGSNATDPVPSVAFSSLRAGTVIGEHKVIFAGPHERVVLEHVAEDRSIFARGAVIAAKWGCGQKPGLYSMLDVLGL